MADLPQIVNTDNVIIKSPTDVVTTATKLSGLQISEKEKVLYMQYEIIIL